jgi:tryptophan synthase alpha chain
MVGFGISNKQTFDSACSYAAGGIIGSRFVTLLDETSSPLEAITRLRSDIGL